MKTKYCITFLICFVLFINYAYNQTDEEIFQDFQFNFAPPGARAMAMGKAFIALADDATAAETNPAGLTTLVTPELSFEYKNTDIIIERFASRDSLFTLIPTEFGGRLNSASFLSFFFPYKGIHFAIFRHQFLNFKDEFNFEPRPIPSFDWAYYPVSSNMHFRGANYGVALAATSGKLSLGISAKLSTLKAEAQTYREYFDYKYSEHGLSKGNMTIIDDSDIDYSISVGLIWKLKDYFSIGAVYTRSPKFKIQEDFGYVLLNDQFVSFGAEENKRYPTYIYINVPDKFGIGLSYRPTQSLTIVTDVVRIKYSQLVENFNILFSEKEYIQPRDYVIDDATEFHLGAEYVLFIGKNPFAIRAGLFTNPEHKIRFVNPNIPIPLAQINAKFEEIFWNLAGKKDTEIGMTVGGGIVIKQNLQIDFAYMFSDLMKELSLSTVVRF